MIIIKSAEEIKIMRQGGKILAKIMKEIEKSVRPGITTKELDRLAENLILKHKAKPSFKNYKKFPASLCVSINEEIVHIIPSERQIKQGDIVSIDLGIFFKGFHTDMAVTLQVGKVAPEVLRLILATKNALKQAIKKVKPGNTFGDIGNTIQKYARSHGFNVIIELCGHGIGRNIHEPPEVLNYGQPNQGEEIKPGMVFCLEPMFTMGHGKIKKSQDGYGFQTADGRLSSHFEHTVAVGKNSCQILTKN